MGRLPIVHVAQARSFLVLVLCCLRRHGDCRDIAASILCDVGARGGTVASRSHDPSVLDRTAYLRAARSRFIPRSSSRVIEACWGNTGTPVALQWSTALGAVFRFRMATASFRASIRDNPRYHVHGSGGHDLSRRKLAGAIPPFNGTIWSLQLLYFPANREPAHDLASLFCRSECDWNATREHCSERVLGRCSGDSAFDSDCRIRRDDQGPSTIDLCQPPAWQHPEQSVATKYQRPAATRCAGASPLSDLRIAWRRSFNSLGIV